MANTGGASIALYGKAMVLNDKIVQSYLLMRDGDDYHLAWYVVPLLVLLALAVVVGLGAMLYCMARGMNLEVIIDVGGGKFLIGCA